LAMIDLNDAWRWRWCDLWWRVYFLLW